MKKYWMNKNCIECNQKISYKSERCLNCAKLYTNLKSYLITHKKLEKVSPVFLAWLAGFWEGEGCIRVGKQYHKTKYNEKRIYYRTQFFVSQKEEFLLKEIKRKLKFGNIYGLGKSNVCKIWSINNMGELYSLLSFIEPYIKSPRRLKQINKVKNHKHIKPYFKYLKENHVF